MVGVLARFFSFYAFLQIRCLRAEYVFEGSSYSKIFKTLCFKACLIRPLLFLLLRSTFIFNFEMAFSEMHLIKYVLVVDLQLCALPLGSQSRETVMNTNWNFYRRRKTSLENLNFRPRGRTW